MTKSAKTLVDEQTTLRDVYASVIGTSDTTGGWVGRNHDTIVILSRESRAALRATAPYASQFPCLFKAVNDYIPKMNRALGQGTDEPGVHGVLQVIPIRTKYLAGKDDMHFTQGTPPPRCPYVTGQVGTTPAKPVTLGGPDKSDHRGTWPASSTSTTDGEGDPPAIAPPPGSTVESHLLALTGLGEANSPGENELIAELIAPTQGMAPSEYPHWGSLLLGPTLRNTKVVLK
jgi:phospholipid/cholesterol/gamma-HCH transport system substrate-binding protein